MKAFAIERRPQYSVTLPDTICIDDSNQDVATSQVTRRVAVPPSIVDPVFEESKTDTKPSLVTNNGDKHVVSVLVDDKPVENSSKKAAPGIVISNDDTTALVSNNSKTFRWKLAHDKVPTLPDFYPLESTAVCVQHTTADQVAERVSKVLWERSIEATYDSDSAKVTCMTSDDVDFRVRLYRDAQLFDDNGVIVEVQRRFGSSLSFHTDTMAILDAAKGTSSNETSVDNSKIPFIEDSQDTWDPTKSKSLNLISEMFKEQRLDTQLLALQMLASLTDSTQMGTNTALALSEAMLEPGNDVGTKVLSMAVDEQAVVSVEMRKKAMLVLSNVLAVVAEKKETRTIPDHVWSYLSPALLLDLVDAASNPRMAELAAKCLESLLVEGRSDLLADEFRFALEQAIQVGLVKHSGLARQADKCFQLVTN